MRNLRNNLKSVIATSFCLNGNCVKISNPGGDKLKVWFTDKAAKKLNLTSGIVFEGYSQELPQMIRRAMGSKKIQGEDI